MRGSTEGFLKEVMSELEFQKLLALLPQYICVCCVCWIPT